jgi:broad specificity phosphatase PhoE
MRCFIRHGQTDYNLESRWMGTTDLPLNAVGIQQAKDVADLLSCHSFDVIFTSPMSRAIQTAEIILAKQSNSDLLVLPSLTERAYGELEGCLKSEQLRSRINSFAGVESEQSVLDRLISASKTIKKHGSFLIVSHSGLFKIMVKHKIFQPLRSAEYLDNSEYVFLE